MLLPFQGVGLCGAVYPGQRPGLVAALPFQGAVSSVFRLKEQKDYKQFV